MIQTSITCCIILMEGRYPNMKKALFTLLLIAIIFSLCSTLAIAMSYAETAEDTSRSIVVKTEVPTFTIDLTAIILAVMATITAIVSKYLIPLIRTERNRKLAKIAVNAAEQLFITGVINDKLEYAEKYLLEHGVKVDTRALIEASVSELNQYKKELDYKVELALPPDADIGEDIQDCCESCAIQPEQVEEPTEG